MKGYIGGISALPIVRLDLKEVAGFLWDKGWAERNAGNISINLTPEFKDMGIDFDFFPSVELSQPYPDLGNHVILITGAGSRMRDVQKDPHPNTCILKLNEEGSAYNQIQKPDLEHEPMPSSELPTHLAIHNMLKQNKRLEKVILHTHPSNLIALTHIRDFCSEERINNMLWSIQPETCVFIHDGLGFVPYLRTGTDDLANATIQKLEKHRMALWEKHGCLALGETIHEAFDLIDIAEKSAEIFFTCKNAGYEVEGISKNDLDELRSAFNIKS